MFSSWFEFEFEMMIVEVVIILGTRGMDLDGMALQKRASCVITSRPV